MTIMIAVNYLARRHRNLIAEFCGIAIGIAILFVICACTANRRVIRNTAFDHGDRKQMGYRNLFPPQYGYFEETECDRIDFGKPHEQGDGKNKLLHDPEGDIDRTKGFDPAEYTVIPDFGLISDPAYEVQITWIRHASFLIQLGAEYQILVDPVIEELDRGEGESGRSDEIGTFYAESPIGTQELPFVGASEIASGNQTVIVAISHDHYDHLNFNTLEKLPEAAHYYVPLGLENEFPSRYSNVTGMDWYTADAIGGLTITFLPANHCSGRSSDKRNHTLWGGWLFEWNDYRVYFAGDSGYSAVFKDIRNRVGEVDICLMPIAAWALRQWHLAPEDAVKAAEDLECKVLIPWGWASWIMGSEHISEPPRRLQYVWDRLQPENMELQILKMGETFSLGPLGEDQCYDCK
jgi:N-acyl-phosphatidylethanolamine-hydrolysing phospholipase D